MRTAVFNYPDAIISISREDPAGGPDVLLFADYIYANGVVLKDSASVVSSPQCGSVGNRLSTISRKYDLSMNRLHAKADEDFDIIGDPATPSYYTIEVTEVNDDNPNFEETRLLKHCQLGSRSIRFGDDLSTVPLQWVVGEYVPPS